LSSGLSWLIVRPELYDLRRLLETLPGGYMVGCWAAALTLVPHWAWQRLSYRRPESLLSETGSVVDIERELGHKPIVGVKARVLSHFPGNQLHELHVNEKTLAVASLPMALDGLRILHLSDLHLSGRLTIDYFRFIARQIRAVEADLLVLTGDVADKDFCVPWLAEIFAGVRPRYGSYFVLGNHDLRLSSLRLVRDALASIGWIDLGGRCELVSIRGERMLVAGNERPWIKSPREFETTLREQLPQAGFRLLLSHSPDQFAWAQSHHFDLVLAGHTHGGQIRFPLIGPLVCPSRYNVRYACGVFHEHQTLMHVSRGTGTLFPLRLDCRPELTTIVLTVRGTNLA
jgi:uncharacterized protein